MDKMGMSAFSHAERRCLMDARRARGRSPPIVETTYNITVTVLAKVWLINDGSSRFPLNVLSAERSEEIKVIKWSVELSFQSTKNIRRLSDLFSQFITSVKIISDDKGWGSSKKPVEITFKSPQLKATELSEVHCPITMKNIETTGAFRFRGDC